MITMLNLEPFQSVSYFAVCPGLDRGVVDAFSSFAWVHLCNREVGSNEMTRTSLSQ